MSDREDVIEEFAKAAWAHMNLPIERVKWAPEVREAYEQARGESFMRAMVAAQKEKARVIARELLALGLLASGEIEWGVEIGTGLGTTVVRSHPNTEAEAKRWAGVHGALHGPAIVVKRRLAGPWVQVEAHP